MSSHFSSLFLPVAQGMNFLSNDRCRRPERCSWRVRPSALTALVVFAALLFCGGCTENVQKNQRQDASFTDYRAVPAVTAEEIAAIEKLKNEREALVYGMMPSSEAFFMATTGKPSGFAALFAEELSELFGIKVKLVQLEWAELVEQFESGKISFTSELSPTPERLEKYAMSAPVARRVLQIFTHTHGMPLETIRQTRKPRYAFLDGSNTYDRVRKAEGDTFEAIFVYDSKELLHLFERQQVDAFFDEGPGMAFISDNADGAAKDYYPLSMASLSLATAEQSLAPFISVLDKYLDAGYGRRLISLYEQGERDYLRHRILSVLTDEERAYVHKHVENNVPIPMIFEGENYPNSFWNAEENEFQGIAVDLLARIADITGLAFVNTNEKDGLWIDNMHALEKGTVAFVSDLTRTKQREGKFLWTENPYGRDYYAMVSLESAPDANAREILYSRVGMQKDAGLVDIYQEWFPGSDNIVFFPNNTEAFTALDRREIDFLMLSRNTLLVMTNYLEKSGYRANIVFDYPLSSQFGFNKNEVLLASIISRVQNVIDVDRIYSRWTSKTFDYSKARMQYLIIITACLSVVFVLLLILVVSQRRMNRRLETAVEIRTRELSIQTQAAESASRAKRDFLSNMSHEIRTPLNAIIGMTEVALRETDAPFKIRRAVKEVATASGHLRDIINDILDFSKIEAGKLELHSEAFHLFRLLDEIFSMMQQRCLDSNINFIIDFSEFGDTCVSGDRLRLKQVLINLIGNAVKFTPEMGIIHYTVHRTAVTKDAITLDFRIRDNGIGIGQEQLSRLFTAFEQADKSISTKFGGTGLGLAISQRIIQQMGGTIVVESELGNGSTFHFTLTLPLAGEPSTPELGDVVVPDLSGRRILVVEDIAVNRLVLSELLSITNVAIEEAVDGQEAVEVFERSPVNHFDLIFMDVQMPRMNGYEATKALRSLERPDAKTIPIFAMTANAYREDVTNALDAGMNDHIAKPVDINIVQTKLGELFHNQA